MHGDKYTICIKLAHSWFLSFWKYEGEVVWIREGISQTSGWPALLSSQMLSHLISVIEKPCFLQSSFSHSNSDFLDHL